MNVAEFIQNSSAPAELLHNFITFLRTFLSEKKWIFDLCIIACHSHKVRKSYISDAFSNTLQTDKTRQKKGGTYEQ